MDAVAPPKTDDAAPVIRAYLSGGKGVHLTDPTLTKAIFLRKHPGWSPDDYDNADQDLIDLMFAIDNEAARRSNERALQAHREQEAAAYRASLERR